MAWKKDTYYITVLRDGEKVREQVTGQITKSGYYDIGVHKAAPGVWVVTDISTGYKIAIKDTQKAAKEWADNNADVILEFLSKPEHAALVKEIEQCRKSE